MPTRSGKAAVTGVEMRSKYSRHQAFTNHLWVTKTAAEAMSLKNGDKVKVKCGAVMLGPFTITGLNMNDGKNILMKNGKEESRQKGTGSPLAFMNLSGDLQGKCKANTATDRLLKEGNSLGLSLAPNHFDLAFDGSLPARVRICQKVLLTII